MEQEKTRMKIVAYDDDDEAIISRYEQFKDRYDLQVVYFQHDFQRRHGLDSLKNAGFSESQVIAVKREELDELLKKLQEIDWGERIEDTPIPFPQDADYYFIDGLYSLPRGLAIAHHLPKDKVKFVSRDTLGMEIRNYGFDYEYVGNMPSLVDRVQE